MTALTNELYPELTSTMTQDERELYVRGVQHGLRIALRRIATTSADARAIGIELGVKPEKEQKAEELAA